MPQPSLDVGAREEVMRLKVLGRTHREISTATGVSVGGVSKIVGDAAISFASTGREQSDRVRAGLQIARLKGKEFGRPRVVVNPKGIRDLKDSGLSWREVSKVTGITKTTAQRAYYAKYNVPDAPARPAPSLTGNASKAEEIRRLGTRGYSHQTIAEVAGVDVSEVVAALNHKEPGTPASSTKKGDRIEEYAAYHKEKFSELLERFNAWIGDTTKAPKPKANNAKSRRKNLVLNDIHTPFHDEEAVGVAIRSNLDADEAWVAGDAMDMFSFSRYEKYHAPFSPVEEFQSGRAFIRSLAERFKKVKVMSGNHDERFLKWLVRDKSIPPSILEFFKLMDPNFLSPLAKVCAGFPNVEVVKPLELDYAKFPFIHQEGDCILSHAEKFSKIPNRATGDVIHWLKSYCEPQGLVKPFRLVVQAHTHQSGKTWCDYGVVGIEAGCLAKVPDYSGDPKLRGAQRPSVVGYTLIFQDDGVTDINASNFVQVA